MTQAPVQTTWRTHEWIHVVRKACFQDHGPSIDALGGQQAIGATREFLYQLVDARGFSRSQYRQQWDVRLLVPETLFNLSRDTDRALCLQWRNLTVCSAKVRSRMVNYWESRAELLQRTQVYGTDKPFALLLLKLEALGDVRFNPYRQIPKPHTDIHQHAERY